MNNKDIFNVDCIAYTMITTEEPNARMDIVQCTGCILYVTMHVYKAILSLYIQSDTVTTMSGV